MKSIFIFLTGCCLVAGCAQPKPADCKGDFKPVNAKPVNANHGKTPATKISCLSGAKHG